ncbi:MAG: hypothetical protein M3066_12585 [Actinomycetota bacterium]|nr:hypothetical protein [Actinomycetota bacterium]
MMEDQDAGGTIPEDAGGPDEAEAEVEGFGAINITRSNIKGAGAMAAPPGTGGVGGPSQLAIKEQGIR